MKEKNLLLKLYKTTEGQCNCAEKEVFFYIALPEASQQPGGKSIPGIRNPEIYKARIRSTSTAKEG